MVRQSVVPPYQRTVLNNKKKRTIEAHNLDQLAGNGTEENNPQRLEYDSIYMMF